MIGLTEVLIVVGLLVFARVFGKKLLLGLAKEGYTFLHGLAKVKEEAKMLNEEEKEPKSEEGK